MSSSTFNPKYRISQRQLAELANVSRTTVTRALSNDPRISTEVTRRIHRLAREHGYRPNAAARSIATQRNNCIGIVVCDRQLSHASYGSLLSGVERATRDAGMRLQVSFCDTTQLSEDELPPIFQAVGVDGIILMGAVSDSLLEKLKSWMMPVVLLGSQIGIPEIDQIAGDPHAAGRCGAQHLVSLGHEKVGLFIGPRKRFVHQEYARGFAEVMRDAGVEDAAIEKRIQECPTLDVVPPAKQLFARCPDLTAVFCDTDMAAWNVTQYLRAIGRDVPGDVSIIGAGGGSRHDLWPIDLTSVDVGFSAMSQSAVDQLRKLIDSGRGSSKHIVIQPSIIEGETARSLG